MANRIRQKTIINVERALVEQARLIDINIKDMIKDKLQETYVDNVRKSYTTRAQQSQAKTKFKRVPYEHTGTFENSIYTQINDDKINVMIRDTSYPNGTSTTKVYDWLVNGTNGGSKPYPYINSQKKNSNESKSDSASKENISWSRNFPTPAHLFELHTKIQMLGYLDSLKTDIKNRKEDIIRKKHNKHLNKAKRR